MIAALRHLWRAHKARRATQLKIKQLEETLIEAYDNKRLLERLSKNDVRVVILCAETDAQIETGESLLAELREKV